MNEQDLALLNDEERGMWDAANERPHGVIFTATGTMRLLRSLIAARAENKQLQAVKSAAEKRWELEGELNSHYETCAACNERRQWEHENEDWLTSEDPPDRPKTEEVGACTIAINMLVEQMRATEEFKAALIGSEEGGE